MTDIVEFLRARYAEQRAAAQTADGIWPGPWEKARSVYGWRVTAGRRQVIIGHPAATEYIASHDAQWALADIDAKLQILDEHSDVNDGDCTTCVTGHWGYPTHGGSTPQLLPCRTLRLLALPYAQHEDYLEEWRP